MQLDNTITSIEIKLPENTFLNNNLFIDLFSAFSINSTSVTFPVNDSSYNPYTLIDFSSNIEIPEVHFMSDDKLISKIEIRNTTGKQWDSYEKYTAIELADLRNRISSEQIKIVKCDHLGVNIPWIEGINPAISSLVDTLSNLTLIHHFPKESNWFFVIPGTESELNHSSDINYKIDRTPKFEIVNFLKTSKPLIQIDVAVNTDYLTFKRLFPEAIFDDKLRNIWIYLKSNLDIDICLVFNEVGNGWTEFFIGERI
ncbi:hypothetical protein KC909_04380 [Candidatus Dojkabacteria bacterium]|uniref:Uncharacterized protein n=1 Tax=Candidatus Dojkabacteria bacterium TaxID=2099670 RepID=A0A955RJL0_9BACT|nr:hypothetical protein [Candidatus Dojkabacteria bacterium]